MLRIGLTGNIASGKSSVSREFARLGARVLDADLLAREVVAPGSAGLAQVVERFGPSVLQPDGALDRAALRARVFGDAAALAALNGIVHPEVGRRRADRAAAAQADGVRVLVDEIPLLFEVGLADEFDAIVFVNASEAERLRRLTQDRGLPESEARAMMSSQGEVAQKQSRATWVIQNSGSREELLARVDVVWREIQAMQAAQATQESPQR